MTSVASQHDQRLTEGHLRQLDSLDRLRHFLADLNYRVGDEPVSTGSWSPELRAIAGEGDLHVVARHDDSVITDCRLTRLQLIPERDIVTRLLRQYGRGTMSMFQSTPPHGGRPHFSFAECQE